MTITERMIQCGKQVIQQELEQGSRLQSKLDKEFANSCIAIQQCKGKIVLFGIGKSGHIGKKLRRPSLLRDRQHFLFTQQKLYMAISVW
ncbi:hypothetical protein [Vibrio metschnikovii]|uniref:hypothetical protein n=1 Tax=Vibrio metschnikovii TaxID=28172 RepID=UPI001E614AB3|nr:hypothetical protein [Vibrio metschnikovii]